jgi:cytochrome c oxidase cbb3-type subunit 3
MRLMLSGVAAAWLAMVACNRGANGSQPQIPRGDLTRGSAATAVGVQPGISPQVVLGPVSNPYAGQASAAATGRQLFVAFNCSGCHGGYGGGGMGPSLRDSLWIYGSEDAQVFSTIAEGRAYGMPAWGGRLPDEQIWMLVSYVKSLSTGAEPARPPVPSQTDVRSSPDVATARP